MRREKGEVVEVAGEVAVLHRSPRRRKTVEARLVDGVLHVYLPDNLSGRRERFWVREMREKVMKLEAANEARRNIDLEARAEALNRRYFHGLLSWESIDFIPPNSTRYGWCDPNARTIRISAELIDAPRFVLDYVIVHELAHLVEPGHDDDFWDLVKVFPMCERARGFLQGWGFGGGPSEDVPGSAGRPVPIRPKQRQRKGSSDPNQLTLVEAV